MPKYYVKSGQIKFIINRNTKDQAILDTLRYYNGKGFMSGPKICVSEVGFESFKSWDCYDTDKYMKRINKEDK